jgi:hypothetical protein
MPDRVKLTEVEERCCHMSGVAFDWRLGAVEQWRAEFKQIPESEHCAGCPAGRALLASSNAKTGE